MFTASERPRITATDEVVLVTSGDSRLSANQTCWPAQEQLERTLTQFFADRGVKLVRAFQPDQGEGHGFISSQRMGMDVFMGIDPRARLVFATAAWQYSHHVLAGLRSHQGPILTVANWSGTWPGLVGLLNLNGSLTKAAVPYSSIWSRDFTDGYASEKIEQWLRTGMIAHDSSHVRDFSRSACSKESADLGAALARSLQHHKAILGIFDEGCMGMYNAILDDELLNPMGIYKERLSQSALVAKMRTVPDDEARAVYQWLVEKGVSFRFGSDPETELTLSQVLEQCRMYMAAIRMAGDFGCDAIGIQYQQGLKDTVPASDLVEGLLNNAVRPPVLSEATGRELYAGGPLVHFNEVDECAGVDALVTNHCWKALGFDPSTTLHDIRWGEPFSTGAKEEFIWLFQISGAAPANHFIGGYAGATSERQPAMYFPLGGGSLKGICKPGEIVWSRIFVEGGVLHADLGRGSVVELPAEETERRWRETTYQWPIMHARLHGVSRDQMMGRHKANHLNVAYAPSPLQADLALDLKAVMLSELGVIVHLCGVDQVERHGS